MNDQVARGFLAGYFAREVSYFDAQHICVRVEERRAMTLVQMLDVPDQHAASRNPLRVVESDGRGRPDDRRGGIDGADGIDSPLAGAR